MTPTSTSELPERKLKITNGLTDDPTIKLTRFTDYRPEATNRTYFQTPPDLDPTQKQHMGVVVPCFDEPSHELQQTLNSMYDSFQYLRRYSDNWQDKQLYILIVQDGWHKAHRTMQKWFYDLFPATIDGVPWYEAYDEFKPTFNDPTSNATFVLERTGYAPTPINTQRSLAHMRKPVKMTILIKINNRRKHNSHEWFLGRNAYAEAINAKYLLLTDAFTLYSHNCLYYLADQLDRNEKLIAVTGRQRLMSKQQQGSSESIFSFGHVLRMMQLHDFELANAVYNGAFSLGGMLPVIPGPCGLYRAKDLLVDQIRDAYFDLVNSEPTKTGWVLANLRNAEDRVLSCYSVIKSPTEKFMAFNPLAVFYFEAEIELKKLMFQRRRWICGSALGYVFLVLMNWRDFFQWKTNRFRQCYMYFQLLLQCLIYFFMGLAPGISIRILFYGLKYFIEFTGTPIPEYSWQAGLMFLSFFGLYTLHVVVHHRYERDPYNGMIMKALILVSLATTVISFVGLGHYYFVYKEYAFTDIFKPDNLFLYLGIATLLGPFIVATFLGGKMHSPLYLIKSFLHYFLFMPLMIAWIGSYSYARTWDLTWGNRPSSEMVELTTEEKGKKIVEFKDKCRKSMIVLLALNLGLFWLPLIAILWLMAIFFMISVFQMACSLIFCWTQFPYKSRTHLNQRRVDRDYKRLSTRGSSMLDS